ncbi:RloB family protein, partial [Herbivorax sp. ANBcel31]|uniref:RloB family protein n=1 Tax=Herbivorax sp. ANBcel31 TaxID=3069754 RepID=UPI0027B05FC5
TAISKRTEGLYRQIWCVFDKDDFSDFDDAICLADKHGIGTAFSNQAFDLWFIMHFKVCNGALHRDKYEDIINSCFVRDINNRYKKPYGELYSKLKNKIEKAVNNAKVGHQNHIKNGGKPSDWESCTTVYKLVSELLKWQKR